MPHSIRHYDSDEELARKMFPSDWHFDSTDLGKKINFSNDLKINRNMCNNFAYAKRKLRSRFRNQSSIIFNTIALSFVGGSSSFNGNGNFLPSRPGLSQAAKARRIWSFFTPSSFKCHLLHTLGKVICSATIFIASTFTLVT